MASLRDIVTLAETNYVSVDRLMEELGLTQDQACQAIKACWDRGLLLPAPLSWFGLPKEDGSLPYSTKEERVQARAVAWTPAHKERWYQKEIAIVWEAYEDATGGVTVRDIMGRLDTSQPRARKILETMVELGLLTRAEASVGGAYGRRPMIYFKSGHPDDFDARNALFVTEAAARKPSSKSKVPKQASSVTKKTARAPKTPKLSEPDPLSGLKVISEYSPFDA